MTREDWRQAHKLINIMVEANQVNDVKAIIIIKSIKFQSDFDSLENAN